MQLQNLHSTVSSLITIYIQHNTYPHIYHEFIPDRPWRIGHFPTSPTGIPHQTLLDYYSKYITGKLRTPLETLQQTTYQNTTIPQISGSTSISPNTAIINTSTRIVQHPGHLQLW